MYVWNRKIYMDDLVRKKRIRYRVAVQRNRCLLPIYLIILSENEDNTLEIYSAQDLWHRYFKKHRMEIVGMAFTKRSAFGLVQHIFEDVVAQEQEFTPRTVRCYFHKKS